MNPEILISLTSKMNHLHTVIAFAANLVWFTIFYILNQMYRHKFLKWLLWGNILHLLAWFYAYFIPRVPTGDSGEFIPMLWQQLADALMNVVPAAVSTIGAVMGVNWLQDRFREFNIQKTAKQPSEVDPQPMGDDPQ